MPGDLIDMSTTPMSPEAAATRIRDLVAELNDSINTAKRLHKLTTTLHIHKSGVGIERVAIQKEY